MSKTPGKKTSSKTTSKATSKAPSEASSPEPSAVSVRLNGIGPYVRVAMGLVFVVAGAAKSWDPIIFYWEAMSYYELLGVAIENWARFSRLTLVLGPIECAVGVALIVNWRPSISIPVGLGLMLLFSGLTSYAWQQEANIDCGCFGTLTDRTPGEALLEDLVMLGALLFAWKWGQARWAAARAARWVGAVAVVALIATGFGFYPESTRVENSDLAQGVRLAGVGLTGTDTDLSQGDYLLELFSPGCSRCKTAVPKLNKWVDTPGLPRVLALSTYARESEQMKAFEVSMRPRYEIASISTSDWKRLTWRHGWPRLAFVRDGIVQRVWEYYEMPTVKQLKRVTAIDAG